ncbi:molybdopterin molybdotransferase MoeA [Rhizobium sp. TRM95111]|uniref:molybdopterin molybdotransferase MoeA n=1 Tax=Rhizobium alarense TaxID=2846851 RepID=UPI001F262FA3|nr:gephyrin-like molybdotransferase Glp [Rhizobium alarense]MCF3638637.1 molybdopterin molybdotransferase MoeA [Rhizobium alarense]
MSLLPVEDALQRLLAAAAPPARSELVGLHEAQGRVLAADITATLTQPPFDSSAMDGYALRHADLAAGAALRVIGRSAAGHAFRGTVGPGETVRIFTGAPVPEGADTVLLQEDAEISGDGATIRATFTPAAGRHIRPRGQDFAEGEAVLKAGDLLDAGRLTVAAAMNHPYLPVYLRPKVAILATGDELVEPGKTPAHGQIVASNSYGIAALARDAGAEVLDLGIAGDDAAAILDAVDWARACGADVLVTLGGASVGDHDIVQPVLTGAGMALDFWRIAMRPGKPLMVGRLGAMQVLGLPGNPVSSLVCSLLFLEPLIRTLARLPAIDRRATAVTETDLAENDKRQDYLRARLRRGADGALLATPFGKQDSSMMKTFARSECLILRRPHAPALSAGSPCEVVVLREPSA